MLNLFRRIESRVLILWIALAAAVWLFLSLADEVAEGDTHAIDRSVLLAVRNPADLNDPIGPRTFEEAVRRKGVTGENLIKLLEARLDNTVYRLGIAPSRPGARQLVAHKHITVNGEVVNVPSFQLRPGDVIGIKESTQGNTGITSQIRGKNAKFNWLDYSEAEFKGTFIAYPERESVPENIKEQLIVELYSK